MDDPSSPSSSSSSSFSFNVKGAKLLKSSGIKGRLKASSNFLKAKQAAGALKKKIIATQHVESDFSPVFTSQKVNFKTSRYQLERFGKALKDLNAASKSYVAASQQMTKLLEEMSNTTWTKDPDDKLLFDAFTDMWNNEINDLEFCMTQMETKLGNCVEQLNREVRETRICKSNCYDALKEREIWKAKLNQTVGHSKNLGANTYLDVQQGHRLASNKFLQLERETVNRLLDFDQHKTICLLEALSDAFALKKDFFEKTYSNHQAQCTLVSSLTPLEQRRNMYEESKRLRFRDLEEIEHMNRLKQGSLFPERFFNFVNQTLPPPLPDSHENEEDHLQVKTVINLSSAMTANIGVLLLTNYRLVFSSYNLDSVLEINLDSGGLQSRGSSSSEILPVSSTASPSSNSQFSIPVYAIARIEAIFEERVIVVWCKDSRVYTFSLKRADTEVELVIFF